MGCRSWLCPRFPQARSARAKKTGRPILARATEHAPNFLLRTLLHGGHSRTTIDSPLHWWEKKIVMEGGIWVAPAGAMVIWT